MERLVERAITDYWPLRSRGYALHVTHMELEGRLPRSVRVWGDFHFLPLGSPFCCMEPGCHVFLRPPHTDGIADAIRRELRLRHTIELEIVQLEPVVHGNVQFDHLDAPQYTPVPNDVNARDGLGRTALWRAANRGYDVQVAELLARGADPAIAGPDGPSLLEVAKRGEKLGSEIARLIMESPPCDDGEWTHDELRAELARGAEAAGWNEPEMDEYDRYDEVRAKRRR